LTSEVRESLSFLTGSVLSQISSAGPGFVPEK
jgi:hypothetical protein